MADLFIIGIKVVILLFIYSDSSIHKSIVFDSFKSLLWAKLSVLILPYDKSSLI
jgi:hypothetical protein